MQSCDDKPVSDMNISIFISDVVYALDSSYAYVCVNTRFCIAAAATVIMTMTVLKSAHEQQ